MKGMRLFTVYFALAGCFGSFAASAQEANSGQLQQILRQYTEVYGGLRDATALTSIAVEGVVEQAGQSMRFSMHRKQPNLLRYRLYSGDSSVTSGFDGRIGWIRTETNGNVEIERASGDARSSLAAQGRFESPLFQHERKNEFRYELLPVQRWEGHRLHVVAVTDPQGAVWHYFVDTQTSRVLRRDRLDASGSILSQTLYRDFQDVGGYPFAHEVEERIAGETVSLARVESISVNPGLLSFYFKEPVHLNPSP
jgi:hypothetical protein